MAAHGEMTIDRALRAEADGKVIRPEAIAFVRDRLAKAQRFVFTPKASEAIGAFAATSPDIIVRNYPSAKAPFPITYIELCSNEFFDQFPSVAKTPLAPGDTPITRLGYLIDRGFVIAVGEDRDGKGFICPIGFATDGTYPADIGGTPVQMSVISGSDREMEALKELQERWGTKDIAEWMTLGGALGTALDQVNDEETREGLLKNVGMIAICTEMYWQYAGERLKEKHLELVKEQMGDVRNVWAAFLWMNQQSLVRYVDKPPSSRLIRGKRAAFPKYRVVEIDVGDRTKVRRAYEATQPREPYRLHDVRSHWRHWGGDENHAHEFSVFPDFRGRWHCACGTQRVRVKNFERGDPSKGRVDHDYEVKL